jgi:sugar phosphate isomerase/epimerase
LKLGVSGMLPGDPGRLDGAMVEELARAGFAGAAVFFEREPAELGPELRRRVAQAFADGGMELVQYGSWPWPVVLPDPDERERSRRARHETLRVAADMGARSISTGPGTLNPRARGGFAGGVSAWLAARENWDQEAFDLLVEELARDAEVAASCGVHVALECHVYTVLRDPESARAVLDAVGSPWIRITSDPGNWVTLSSYFDTASLIEHAFDVVGDGVLDGHAKDVRLADTTEVQFKDAVAGDGAIDFPAYVRKLAEVRPDAYLIVEHTPAEDVSRAREHLLAAAEAAGVRFD